MKTLVSAVCFAGARSALRAAVVPVAGGAAHLDEGAGEALAHHLLPCSASNTGQKMVELETKVKRSFAKIS